MGEDGGMDLSREIMSGGMTIPSSAKIIVFTLLLILFLLAWAPWLNDDEIHDRVFQAKAQKDGTYARVIYPNGTIRYELICDYKVVWLPFGRYVASCEGGYYVTFWGQIVP